MATAISSSPMSSENLTFTMPNSIPMEIILQFDSTTSTGSSVDFGAISHCREIIGIPNSQTTFEDNSIDESIFSGRAISLSSDANSFNEVPDILPLDYRLGRSIANDNLKDCIPQNESVFINDEARMEIDSLCGRPNEWEIDTLCGDSIDTEEDMSSISEWINSDEDFWKCQ